MKKAQVQTGHQYGLYTGDRRCTADAYTIHSTLDTICRLSWAGSKWLWIVSLALLLLPQFATLAELFTSAPALGQSSPQTLVKE